MKNLYKSSLFLIFVSTILFSCATTEKVPEWIIDKNSVYPNDTFIAETGNGKSAQESENDAISRISFFLNTSVNSNRTVNRSLMHIENDKKSEYVSTNKLDENIFLSTNANLNQVMYTKPFYIKQEKTWYCVAYINRNDAWNQYRKEVESAKNSFYSFYNKAKAEQDGIKSIILYGKAIEEGVAFMDKISYAQLLLYEKTNSVYENDMKVLSSIKSEQTKIMLENPVFIYVKNDSSDRINNSISSVFSELGFTVSKNKARSSYNVIADFEQNVSGDGKNNPFTSEPSISISMEGKSGTVYSYFTSGKKITAWTMQKITDNAVSSIINNISSELKDDFSSKVSGDL